MKSSKAARELAENELIGLDCEITNSTQRNLIGIKGKIIDETLQTITVETEKGEKRIQKKSITLKIKFPEKTMTIKGDDLTQRPHERLRKLWRKLR